ncbi:aldo/keto reductase [Botrimarina hoheduenensis]|uniref:General stress protein 69 n=1 Tax=Botrimarina hoheduenensis TaxID=2528000 RepID=A0A5C5WEF3_9BACT|nr:aldo/keto reductase [Botrimarina hoheduenensis]TWT48533.1 General stress protein 69 [Botrimarina hoheduenensis]
MIPSAAAKDRRLAGIPEPFAPVALGCWPMAGVTTLGATHADGVATVHAALDAGVTHLDTAYVYGPNGESDRILAEALRGRRNEVVLASKVGIHYEADAAGVPQMTHDGRPATLRTECETLLQRLGVDSVDLLYLHSPDPSVPIGESAVALAELMAEGKTRAVGASNCTLPQIKEFAAACPLAAVQLPYNLLQRDIEQETLPWCRTNGVAVMVYWALMKGLLAGRLPRDEELDQHDNRRSYPMFQGEEWQRNQDFVEALRAIAQQAGVTVAQLVVNWTMTQPGVTAVLCGAKRPEQIRESAGALGWSLSPAQRVAIDQAIAARGVAAAKRTFR